MKIVKVDPRNEMNGLTGNYGQFKDGVELRISQ